jgi:hypothetical protein
MDTVFAWAEGLAISIWIRESLSIFAFPGILTLHTVGLAFLAGAHTAISLRVLGVAERLPLEHFEGFFPVGWCGFWVSAVTGVALVLAYPAKALTNPLFFVKLTLVALALWFSIRIRRTLAAAPVAGVQAPSGRILAACSLVLWSGAIISGRLLAYTYTRLLVGLDGS